MKKTLSLWTPLTLAVAFLVANSLTLRAESSTADVAAPATTPSRNFDDVLPEPIDLERGTTEDDLERIARMSANPLGSLCGN